MAIVRNAAAKWQGDLKTGKGNLTTDSKTLSQTPYSFSTRFEGAHGTNPEELIAAAHAGCFTMALSAELQKVGIVAESLDTTAAVSLESKDGGFAITKVALDLRMKIPGADAAKVEEAVQNAKKGCPVSKVLNAEITLVSKLV